MLNVLQAGKLNSVEEFFLASSSEVYQTPKVIPTPEDVPLIVPDPYNPRFSYGGGKILSELLTIHMGKNYFKKCVIFRPHNVYGPDMGEEHVIPELTRKIEMLQQNKNNKVLNIQGSGKETRSYIYIDDFAEAFQLLLKRGHNQTTYNVGTNDEINSRDLAIHIANIIGVKIKIKANPLTRGSTIRRIPDIKKIRRLGFRPKIPLEIGLKKTVNWYLLNPKKSL
jgi:nucleoside-diphosphate-sugar epimerase